MGELNSIKPRLSPQEVPQFSQYAARSLNAMALQCGSTPQDLIERFEKQPVTRDSMRSHLEKIDAPEMLDIVMRQLRREVMTALIVRDLSARADFQEVVSTVTALAEEAVSAAVRVHSRKLAQRFGVPMGVSGAPQDLLVVGMGKLGGEELNVSSDIDLVFVYDEGGETQAVGEFSSARRQVTNHEFFDRLARRVIASINEIDGTGFVFRVDMRLRPFGDSGPLVISSAMLEEYLYSEGRDWERFAWLKGRVVNRAVFMQEDDFSQAVRNLESLVRPFVFRKYVDFSAISALARIHEMIRAETTRREAGRDTGINVKLGSGGIREIEFICQTFQIIRAGREPQLRLKSTLSALSVLEKLGVMNAEQVKRLSDAYVFLRNLEHAIQYVDDQQTHRLPPDEKAREQIAVLLGLSSSQMVEKLMQIREYVAQVFDGIFQVGEEENQEDDWPEGWSVGFERAKEALANDLEKMGYGEARHCADRVLELMGSKFLAAQTESARTRMAQLVKRISEMCIKLASDDKGVAPEVIFTRFITLLEVIAGRSTYVSLLIQYPKVCEKVALVLKTSAWAADYLTAHPIVLDELVDERVSELDNFSPVDWSGWQDDLWEKLREVEGDQETQMNLLRDAHHAAVFKLLMADLEGRFTVERLADQLSALADAVLEMVITLAWQTIASRHCDVPKFAVVAYGKLGGKELSYASDLDLIYLYDDPSPEASKNYTRLVRRMMSWLTVQTSSGILFDVDLRLRPNGENGLVVSSFEMFKRYQRNEDGTGAWPWEHQALTRARFCAGDRAIGQAFEKEREAILRLPRDKAKVFSDVSEMRARMLEGHPNPTPLFDVKHDRGGMVDVEFAVQAMVLAYSHEHPELVNNFGNILLLEMAARAGLIGEELAQRCVSIYRNYRHIQRKHRLELGDGPVRVDRFAQSENIATVMQLWKTVFGSEGPLRK